MTDRQVTLGLTEQELREELEQELVRAMRVEGNAPTVHAIAHAFTYAVAHAATHAVAHGVAERSTDAGAHAITYRERL